MAIGWRVYGRHALAFDGTLATRLGALYRVWKGKYFVDELYDRTFVRVVVDGSERVFGPFDKYVVDGLVNAVGYVTRGAGLVLRYAQNGVVQTYAAAIVVGVLLVISLMLFG